jgi:hypothetical protein
MDVEGKKGNLRGEKACGLGNAGIYGEIYVLLSHISLEVYKYSVYAYISCYTHLYSISSPI